MFFKKVKSLEDLKSQFRALAQANHPDNGGNAASIQAINAEYDQLFPIWRARYNATAAEPTTETASSTRHQFYTAWGWAGDKYDGNMSLKTIAQNIRAYVKELYPTYKFSITTSYASMCQELHVALMEAPHEIYKTWDELTDDDLWAIRKLLVFNNLLDGYAQWTRESIRPLVMSVQDPTSEDYSAQYLIHNDLTRSVLDDVSREVNSYNYDDCDSQIDYFDVNFYYFGIKIGKWDKPFKAVPKTARIEKSAASPAAKPAGSKDPEPEAIAQKTGYTYKITKGEDTRDGSELWLVRIQETLDRPAYAAEAAAMKERGGYYSKFRKAFIFRIDPAEILTA